MKILHLTTFLQNGAGRIIVELAREQQRLGHEVTVVASRRGVSDHGNDEEYLDTLSSLDMPAHLVGSTFERSQRQTVEAVGAIDKLLSAGSTGGQSHSVSGDRPHGHEPDVIHTHAAVPSLIALLLAGVRRTPIGVIQTMHGWGETETAEQTAADVGVLNLVDRVAVPSCHSATLLEDLGVRPAQIMVVPYGVSAPVPGLSEADDATWIAMARARRAGRLVVVCVGTLGPRTNQTLLVEALRRVDRLNPLVVFIGDGDDRPLREAVECHGCAENVRIHGYSRSARTLASGADVLVLPSRSQGQPISILEAFSDGLLVATSDIPELVELVDDGVTGFRFRSDDAQALSEMLARVACLSNSDRRAIRAAARGRYTSDFTLSRMVERYRELYTTLRGRKKLQRSTVTRSAA
jgi:glycosyltransferase involved in cell wall biosynthesis